MYDFSNLNEQQKMIVCQTDGPILVSAGAGSGKTRLLVHRIPYLIATKNVPPYNIVAITFTNKATREMKKRITALEAPACDVWVSTFHSMCARILRENIQHLEGYTRNYTIYDDGDSKKALNLVIKQMGIDDEKCDNIRWHISNAKNKGLSPSEYGQEMQYHNDIDDIVRAYAMYDEELHKNNALDFDDLLMKTLVLLQTVPSVRDYYQELCHYILVDEFQDTNLVQYKILRILSAKYNNIFVVGDEDQSIYGWRGADIENVRNFMNDYAGCKVYKLEQNYRSTKNILSVANMLIAHNSDRLDKTLFTEGEEGDKVKLVTSYDENEEGDYIARAISNLASNGVAYRNIAVLMRISSLSRIMEEKLLNYNIPYKVSGIFKFFERMEIKNLLAYMSTVVNDKDEISLMRIINYPKRGIGEVSITKMQQLARYNSTTLRDVVINYSKYGIMGALANKLQELSLVLSELIKTVDTMPVTEWVKTMLSLTGINMLYTTTSEEDVSRKLNIEQFIQSVAVYEESNDDATIQDYLQSVTLQNDMDDEQVGNAVSISTIHASKGLEFDYVFIVGAEEGIFPLSRSMEDNRELQEERRLMYVAVTRARKQVRVSMARSRFLYGKRSYTLPSRFIAEMGLDVNKPRPQEYYQKTQNMVSKPLSSVGISTTDDKMWAGKLNKQPSKFKDYVVGEMVLHPKFGIGTIIKTELVGDNSYVSVNFKTVGVKALSLSFAPLQLIKKGK